jgi:hypothetical protein
MKRFLYLLLAASMLFAYGCTGDTTTISTPTGSDTLSGTLRDPGTNAPIPGALIKNGINQTRSDATGNWSLGSVSETTAVTLGGAPEFMITITDMNKSATNTLSTETTYPNLVYRTVGASQSLLGPNDLTVGKLNATVTGQILNDDGSPAVGANVWLTYLTDAHSGTLSLNSIGTAYSKSAPVTTGTDGRFIIDGVETGAIIFVSAQDSTGTYSLGLADAAQATGTPNVVIGIGNLRQLPIIDAYTTNLYVEYFFPVPDTDQPLQVANTKTTVSVGGVDYLGPGYPAGATTVTFVLSRPAQPTTYTGTNAAGGQAWLDVIPNPGVAYTLDYTLDADLNIIEIKVSFTTVAAGFYPVGVDKIVHRMLDTNGNRGIAFSNSQVNIHTP